MVLLESKMLPLGKKAPDFSLPSVDGHQYCLNDFDKSNALLVAFICNHCPYVRAIEDRLIKLGRDFDKRELEIIAICSNDAKSYPEDSKEQLLKRSQEKNYGFVYLLDSDQSVAKNYGAVCTPDFYLLDQNRSLFYHGELDDNWQDEKRVRKKSMHEAVQAIIDGKPAPKEQRPSIGCSIKWLK